MRFKMVKQATFDRNVKSGKWIKVGADSKNGSFLIRTAHDTRGVHNGAGVMWNISIDASKQIQAQKAAINAAARARIIADGGRV